MAKNNQNFEFHSGDSVVIEFTVVQDDGTAKDLNNATVEWGMAKHAGAPVVVSKSSSTGGITITDPAGGKFEVELKPSDTKDLTGEYYHETEVTDASSNVVTVATGEANIKEDTV